MYDGALYASATDLTQEQMSFLRELVLLPSYSGSKADVDKVGRCILAEMAPLPMKPEIVSQTETGDHLIFRSPACSNYARSILLVGHMDTVFPPGSAFDFFREQDGKVFGPGVIDMKGGLAVAIYALKILHRRGLLDHIPLTLICNSDEEIGSPTSTGLIRAEAEKGLLGLVFECGGMEGEIVTGRKGKTGFNLEVSGRAGHAAFAGNGKASAILELAHKVIAIEQLNDPERQLVVNVGIISGGVGPNTVAESAGAKVDIRYLSPTDGESCSESIHRIAQHNTVTGTSGRVQKTSGRAPMEQTAANRQLFELIREQAEPFHLKVKEELRSGVSDANTLSAAGLPVVDGMGPIGDCDHSDREYMISDSLPEKTLLTARVIESAWHRYRGGDNLLSV